MDTQPEATETVNSPEPNPPNPGNPGNPPNPANPGNPSPAGNIPGQPPASAPTANPSSLTRPLTSTPSRPRPQNEPATHPQNAFSPATRPRRTEGDIPPLSPRSFFLSRCFSAPISASPRLRVKITLSGFPPHSTTGSSVPSNPEPKATSLRCLRARSFFLVASLRLSPRLRVSASKSHSRVSHPIPPRARPSPQIPSTPDSRHPPNLFGILISTQQPYSASTHGKEDVW
jgi:hypothetical protein